ncbi:phosphomannomutase [Arthrobacter sp. Hiyo8]|nr:phosphomannomutase [Arthrobacter sp. Hiyo8]
MTSEQNKTFDLSASFKAYDVRGIVGESITSHIVESVGAAFVDTLGLAGETVLVGGDMRPSSPEFIKAFADGAARRGANVQLLDLISTDELYYACGALNAAGATFTASHNPAEYNGIKMSKAGAQPISSETGLKEIQALAEKYLNSGSIPAADVQGKISTRDVLKDYSEYLRSLVDLKGSRPLKIVVDAGNGMAGLTTPAVLGDQLLPALPFEIVPLYFELDGSFPNHPANPLEPENLRDLQAAVIEHGADIGLAFDGDADRCFVIDEKGEPVSPSAITGMVARREIARAQAAGEETPVIIHNLLTSRAVPELVAADGGRAVRTRVGTLSSRLSWPKKEPSSAANTRRTSTSAIFGTLTPACLRPCMCWPHWASRMARCPNLAASTSPMSLPVKSIPKSRTRQEPLSGSAPILMAKTWTWTPWTAAPSPRRTVAGGSIFVPPTRSLSYA